MERKQIKGPMIGQEVQMVCVCTDLMGLRRAIPATGQQVSLRKLPFPVHSTPNRKQVRTNVGHLEETTI